DEPVTAGVLGVLEVLRDAAAPARDSPVLPLHDALPISEPYEPEPGPAPPPGEHGLARRWRTKVGNATGCLSGSRLVDVCDEPFGDRKSTRLNSSHVSISYAVFLLKTKTLSAGTDPHEHR